MAKENLKETDQIELDLDEAEETEVDLSDAGDDEAPLAAAEDDQFEKAESNTQKRIDRLTKKMREAERREEEAMRYAQNVKTEA